MATTATPTAPIRRRFWRRNPATTAPETALSGTFGPFATVLEHERARWFLWTPAVFAAGAAAYFGLPSEPALGLALLLILAAVALRLLVARGGTTLVVLANVGLIATIGFTAAKVRTELVREPVLQAATGEVEARGFVEQIEPRAGGGMRITLRVVALGDTDERHRPLRIRVSTSTPDSGLRQGDAVAAWVKLRPPAGPAAPGDYDFSRYAFYRGIGAVGFLTRPPARQDVGFESPFDIALASRIGAVRRHIAERVAAILPGQTGAIATALITGERGGIDEATNSAYRAAGLYHVLSISGLHMAIMGGAVFFAVRFLLAMIPAIALRYDIKKWAAAAAIVGALAYLAISGGAFATIRSFLMIAVMFAAILFNRPALALRNVAIAALLILIVYPESVLDPGFQMSFAAVIALVTGYGAYERLIAGPRDRDRGLLTAAAEVVAATVASTLIASLAIAPLALYHFHQSQHFAVLANALAMPSCNLIVMPMALASLAAIPFGLEALPLWIMGLGIDAMTATAQWVASLPGATGVYPAFSPAAIVLVAAGGLLLALCHHRVRYAGLLLAAIGASMAVTEHQPDVIVSSDGNVVALRGEDGRLAFSAARWEGFTVERWLERDGDTRPVAAVRNGAGFVCDQLGCVARLDGIRIVVAGEPEGLETDCALADILIVRYETRTACAEGPGQHRPLQLDRVTLAETGAVTLNLARNGEKNRTPAADHGLGTGEPAETASAPPGANQPHLHRWGAPRQKLPPYVTGLASVADWQGNRPWSQQSRGVR